MPIPVAKYLPWVGSLFVAAGGGYLVNSTSALFAKDGRDDGLVVPERVPTRRQLLAKIREQSSRDKPFDVLIVGGGATGTGCALDAVTRGLSTVLIEREDFGSGTSSKSTKLVHGGVRYLEKAVFNFDINQLKLVFEALHERQHILENAAHLAKAMPILTPCYYWWEVPYYWAGLKAYDLVAGTSNLVLSKYVSPRESVNFMPTLAKIRSDGKSLKGTIMYYDGSFNDARLNVTLACTSAAAGAAVANYVEARGFIKNEDGKVIGVRCQDRISNDTFDIYAKVVINATGPFVDQLRQGSDPRQQPLITVSSGAHVTLPSYYGSDLVGLIVPKTKDGRVVFMLPWQDYIIAGTTDEKCDITTRPVPSEAEISFILDAISDYLAVRVRRQDILSAWSGIRPLASDPRAKDTQSLVRDHVIVDEPDGSLTVTGGKWTTYRRMAEDTLDAAVATGRLPLNVRPSQTIRLKLLGAQGYTPTLHAQLAQQYQDTGSSSGSSCGASSSSTPPPRARLVLDSGAAKHLAMSYGDRSNRVLQVAEERGLGSRKLATGHPVLEAEVVYCAREELCETVEDFLARRTRLAFQDARAAAQAAPRVAELMAEELGWNAERRNKELQSVQKYLATFCVTGAGIGASR